MWIIEKHGERWWDVKIYLKRRMYLDKTKSKDDASLASYVVYP